MTDKYHITEPLEINGRPTLKRGCESINIRAAAKLLNELESALIDSLDELKKYEKTAGKMPYTKSRRKFLRLTK